MNSFPLYLTRWAAWAPGLETIEAQKSWGIEKTKIRKTSETPALEFLPPLFRRRLSQLSKMVLQVWHTLIPHGKQVPCVFASYYGEINKQYKISKGLIDTQEVSPSTFSLSVFNAPVFLLSIAGGNKDTGSAIYAGDQCLSIAFLETLGFLKSRIKGECVVIFADEYLPSAYHSLLSSIPEPYAFGMVFSTNSVTGSNTSCTIEIKTIDIDMPPKHPLSLLRWLVTDKQTPFSFNAPGMELILRIFP